MTSQDSEEQPESSPQPTSNVKILSKEFANKFIPVSIGIILCINTAFGAWETSHERALVQGVLGILLALFALLSLRIWLLSGVAIILFAILLYFRIGPTLGPPPARGWLQPANEPTPPNACDGLPDQPEGPLVLFGSSAAVLLTSQAGSRIGAVKLGQCDSLSIGSNENGASIYAVIYDESGRLIGEIVDNGFKLNEGGLVIERSGDLSTLVVHDARGNEIIYVRYLNKKTFRVRGIFYCPKSLRKKVQITDEAISVLGKSRLCSAGADAIHFN